MEVARSRTLSGEKSLPPFSPRFSSSIPSVLVDASDDESSQNNDTQKNSDCPESFRAPEQRLTLMAVRLAVLDKVSGALGQLAFIWATVVLLGGFVGSLQEYDFWVISALLITGGARVLFRSQEVEWQGLASRSTLSSSKLKRAGMAVYQAGTQAIQSGTTVLSNAVTGIIYRPNLEDQFEKLDNQGTELDMDKDGEGSTLQHAAQEKVGEEKEHVIHFSVKRTWSKEKVPLIPFAGALITKKLSGFLHLLQIISAMVAIGFSLERLCTQRYGTFDSTRNRNSALNVYYALMLAEAFIFLIERAYWEFKISWRKLLVQVSRQCELGDEHLDMVKDFFYDVYSSCLNGSSFDGIDKDLVSFSIDRIQSSSGKDQLGGVWIMSSFVEHDKYGGSTVRRIGTTPGVIERLLDMLSWKNEKEREIRRAAASVLSELVYHQGNCFRIVASAGGLGAIVSLLIVEDHVPHNMELKVLGLKILFRLAQDHRHCVKIGQSRGLIPVLISSIEVKSQQGVQDVGACHGEVFKKSLEILKMLAATTGVSGQSIRTDIAKAVSALGNLRDILHYGSECPDYQAFALDILTSLAKEDGIRNAIGSTGGAINILLTLFLKQDPSNSPEYAVSLKAGKALNILALQNSRNCIRIARKYFDNEEDSEMLESIIRQLKEEDPKVSTCAAKILRNLYAYLTEGERQRIASCTRIVMRRIMRDKDKILEACLGLAAYTIPMIATTKYQKMFKEDLNKTLITKLLVRIACGRPPLTRLPRIRRYSVELITELMSRDEEFLVLFRQEAMEKKLEQMLGSISEVENFYTFSGAMGMVRHKHSLEDLVQALLHHLHKPSCKNDSHPTGCLPSGQ